VGSSLTICAPGTTTITYGSTDAADNTEAAKSATVSIDTSIPSAKLYDASVRRGRVVKLRFRIGDAPPSCGAADLTIAIRHSGRMIKTVPLADRPTDMELSTSFRCTLTPGRYRWSLLATDLAGNQGKTVSAPLLVEPADRRVERAIGWALAQRGSHSWDNRCLTFVNDAYENAGVTPRRWYAAIDAARALKASSHKGVPPRGAYVFYFHPPSGHVALSLGGGRIVHAFGYQGVIVSNYLGILKAYPSMGMTYCGWAIPKTTAQVSLGL
jgi:hypothetical protein